MEKSLRQDSNKSKSLRQISFDTLVKDSWIAVPMSMLYTSHCALKNTPLLIQRLQTKDVMSVKLQKVIKT